MANITLGIDVGQRVDPTAICVTELQWRKSPVGELYLPAYEDHHIVRHMERLPLGTDYPTIVKRLVQIVRAVEARVVAAGLHNQAGEIVEGEHARVKVYIDATGVGQPVVDMMKQAGVAVVGVYFTHGDRRSVVVEEATRIRRVHLGKAWLVARLQALLQTRRIHAPDTSEARAMAQELLDYEIKIDQNANDKYGAFRVGTHDDLVTALGLTVQEVPKLSAALASSAGHTPAAMPVWAGGSDVAASPGALSTPGMVSRLSPDLPAFRGLNNWGAEGGSGIERLRR